jgi:hypothetical protein
VADGSPLSVEACRHLLGASGAMLSEAEVVRLRDQLYTLARIDVTLREQSTKKPADIVLPADVQEAIEERAAVLEFDAGFTRRAATEGARPSCVPNRRRTRASVN